MRAIIAAVARRIHVAGVRPGEIALDAGEARHAREVLRLPEGEWVEVFDDAGAIAIGVLLHRGRHDAAVRVERIAPAVAPNPISCIIAAAVPKGERADWMIEKLSELGTAAFIPLAAARSVVLPEGRNKRERWMRLATESAKQSRRSGVMRVDELTPLAQAVMQFQAQPQPRAGWFLATEVAGIPIVEALRAPQAGQNLTLFVGPEGGWTQSEIAQFVAAGMLAVRLTPTVLRVETAAIAAAAMVAMQAMVAMHQPIVSEREK